MLAELLRRSAWLAAGSALGRVLPLLVLLAASQRLPAGGFATISAAFAWAGVATSLSTTGLATVMAQQLGPVHAEAQRRAVLRHYLLRSLAAAGALALLVMLAGGSGAALLFGATLDTRAALPAAVSGALWSQVSLSVAALNGSHQPRRAAATLALSGLLQGLPMALALWADASPLGMAWAMAAGSAAGVALAALQLHRVFGAGWLTRPTGEAVTPVTPVTPVTHHSAVAWQTVAVAMVMPVGFFASSRVAQGADGAHQLALYFLLEQFYQVLTYGPALLGQALMPMVSRQAAATNGASGPSPLPHIVKAALLLAAAGLLLAALVGWRLDALIVALDHAVLRPGDAWACRWMLACAALVACTSLLGGAMQGRGDMALAGQLNVGWCALFLAGTWTLTAQGHGTAGLQVARLAATLLLISATAAILLRQASAERLRHHSPPIH
jgi:O-antigen/teichoic acid export membrane protein